jgi:ribosomal protein S12 methylthiotransferase
MTLQQGISARRLAAKVGTTIDVLIDTVDGTGATGRSKGDAPEIDGSVHVSADRPLAPGDIVPVTIERADAYDLWGRCGAPGSATVAVAKKRRGGMPRHPAP